MIDPNRTRQDIEGLFARVNPGIGAGGRCPTGTPYTTYAVATRSPQMSLEMLVNTFRMLAVGAAAQKHEGAPVMLDDRTARYLYWRKLPSVDSHMQEGDPIPWFMASCRAVVSSAWEPGGDVGLVDLSAGTLETFLNGVRHARTSRGLAVNLRPEDVLKPELVWQLARFCRGGGQVVDE